MGVLAMLELEGDTDELVAATGRLGQQIGRPAGLMVR